MEISTAQTTGYAMVDGLKMYYEIHGSGQPVVILHGGFMSIEALGPLLPALAQIWQVIAVELEGHGRTTDLERPLSFNQMAQDVAGLLAQLEIEQADIMGYSLGGMVALRLGIQFPNLVGKLVVVSASYNNAAYYPAVVDQWSTMSTQTLAGTPLEQGYARLAPNPARWPGFVEKMKHLLMDFKGWSAAEVQAIKATTLLLIGDADLIQPEAALELWRLLGGSKREVFGMGETFTAQLAILPGTNHFNILSRLDLLLPIVTLFLTTPDSTSR